MATINFDGSDFFNKIGQLAETMEQKKLRAVKAVADEILRLSQFEVPHDTGQLQNTGHVEPGGSDDQIVGYNKIYAARLHEHPEYHFQGGRKGKYLEDPIKRNLSVFGTFVQSEMSL